MSRVYNNYSDIIDFTRASTGTYLDSDGVLKTASVNVPRVEYDADGNLLGLLVEEQRTNLHPRSQTAWNLNANTSPPAVNNAGIAPDGTQTAWLIPDGATGFCQRNVSIPADTNTYTYSFYVKKISTLDVLTLSFIGIVAPTLVDYSFNITFTFSTLTFSNVSHNETVEYVGNGWYRISMQFVNDGTGTIIVFRTDAESQQNKFLFWGAQLEAGSFPTSYIKTEGATATRSADVASIATSEFGENDEAGTIVVDFDAKYTESGTGYPRIFEYGASGTTSERITLFIGESTNNSSCAVWTGNVNQGSSTVVSGLTGEISSSKFAVSFKKDLLLFSFNGGTASEDTQADIISTTDRDTIKIGGSVSLSTANMNGHIKSLKYYPRALTAEQIEALTS